LDTVPGIGTLRACKPRLQVLAAGVDRPLHACGRRVRRPRYRHRRMRPDGLSPTATSSRRSVFFSSLPDHVQSRWRAYLATNADGRPDVHPPRWGHNLRRPRDTCACLRRWPDRYPRGWHHDPTTRAPCGGVGAVDYAALMLIVVTIDFRAHRAICVWNRRPRPVLSALLWQSTPQGDGRGDERPLGLP